MAARIRSHSDSRPTSTRQGYRNQEISAAEFACRPDGYLHAGHSAFEDRETLERWIPPKARAAAAKVKRMTFGEYAAAWLPARKTKRRPLAELTRDHYQDLLDRFILPTFADVQLTAITPDMVDHWYELTAMGRPTSKAHAYGLLRTILGTAVDRDLTTTANPAKVRGGGSTKRRHKVSRRPCPSSRPSPRRCPSGVG
jgi:hypothetical protein